MTERRPDEPAPASRLDSNKQTYVRSQYRTQDNLAVRIQTHERYSERNDDFASWVLDTIPWQGHEIVVDVGCGAGFYIDAVLQRTPAYIAGDLSLGMLQGLARVDIPRLNLDARQLPLRDGAADVILANHMLYHVPDIDQALGEFTRVLKAGGRLLAATNSDDTMAELEALQRDAMERLGTPASSDLRTMLTFTLENGESYLRRHFDRVERHQLANALIFPDAQPVVDYIGSSFERYEKLLPHGVSWPDVAEALFALLTPNIRRDGAFRVNKLSGVFVAWNE